MKTKRSKLKFNWIQLIGVKEETKWQSFGTQAVLHFAEHKHDCLYVWHHWKHLNRTSQVFLFGVLLSVCMLYHVPPQPVWMCAALSASMALRPSGCFHAQLCPSVFARLCSCKRTCICVHPCKQTIYWEKTRLHALKCFLFSVFLHIIRIFFHELVKTKSKSGRSIVGLKFSER